MPRVHTKTKNRGGKAASYDCVRCSEPIVPGQKYNEWSFRYGGTFRQHVEHGTPRRSQLTQSKMGEVYGAVESVEDLLASEGWDAEDVKAAMEEAGSVLRDVATEYEEAAEHFGGQGENQERYEGLDGWADEFESFDVDEKEEDESDEDYRDRVRDDAENVLTSEPF